MLRFDIVRRALGIGGVVVLVAGCGGLQAASNGTMPAAPALASATTGPPSCKGQRTTKKYASIDLKLKTKGGSFCIPAFGSFGGSLQYPGVERSVKLTLRTSTQNIYYQPQLGNGTPIVYLNLHFHAGTHFRSHLQSKGGVTSPTIDPGDTYTAFGIVAVGHLELMFPPCYTVATQGPYGGVLQNVGRLFSDTTITGAGFGVIEIYSGEQVSRPC